MVTGWPARRSSYAAARPAGPPPITPTDPKVAVGTGPCASCHTVAAEKLSTPNCSVTKRFRARIATGASTVPRRHADSHGAAQTRPQMEANGLGARAMRYASRNRPSAIAVTYAPASVWTGHAARHGSLSHNHWPSGTDGRATQITFDRWSSRNATARMAIVTKNRALASHSRAVRVSARDFVRMAFDPTTAPRNPTTMKATAMTMAPHHPIAEPSSSGLTGPSGASAVAAGCSEARSGW